MSAVGVATVLLISVGPPEQVTAPAASKALTASKTPAAPKTQSPAASTVTSSPSVGLSQVERVRRAALRYVGRPYVVGGQGRPGFDCSGFVRRVYREAGYALPRVSRDQARVGRSVALDAIAPGDLLFFADRGRPIRHVGLYLGRGELIHASSGRGRVSVDDLSGGWFRRRLVAARRILGGRPNLDDAQRFSARDEHGDDFGLSPMLRRSARQPAPGYGPELAGSGATGIGVRTAVLTEDGETGLVVAPELSLVYDDWGFELTGAVVLRFQPGQAATIGSFKTFKDYFRFLRTVRLGLPGADFELAASRLGDLTLGSGALVDHAVPGAAGVGVPGLTVGHTPLPATFAVRSDFAFFRTIVDDGLRPRLVGAEVGLNAGRFTIGVAGATDRAARGPDGPGSVDGLEAYGRFHLVDGRRWSVDVFAQGALLRSFSEVGLGTDGGLRAQYRLGEAGAVSIDVHAGYQGPRALYDVFGPTYLAHRARHGEALVGTRGRPVVGGAFRLDAGKWRWSVAYSDGVGPQADALDRSLRALWALRGLALGATRLLDLRAVYVVRAFGRRRGVADVAQVGLRLRLSSWFATEAYFQLGRRGDGGLGLTLALSI